MTIGVLSDTHDDTNYIQKALYIFEKSRPELLVFCGDATTPSSLEWFCEYRIIYTYGNGDFLTGEIQALLKAHNPLNYAGFVYEGELSKKMVGVTHGHLEDKLKEMLYSGRYDYIFSGHTHLRMDKRIGKTRVINPGSLGGLKKQSRSVALLDIEMDQLHFEIID